MGMPGTRTVKEAEILVRQVEQQPPHFQGESGGTWTVLGVNTFVHPLGVVEDGEKLHDLDVGTGLLG